jgi:hypothetical protein
VQDLKLKLSNSNKQSPVSLFEVRCYNDEIVSMKIEDALVVETID